MAKHRNRRYERIVKTTVRFLQKQPPAYRAMAFGAKPKRR